MDKQAITAFLLALNSSVTGTRPGWVLGHCCLGPWSHGGKDEHPSFGVKLEANKKSICKCLSCGFGGELEDLILEIVRRLQKDKDLAHLYDIATAMELVNKEFEAIDIVQLDIPDFNEAPPQGDLIYPDDFMQWFIKAEQSPECMEYIGKRNLSKQDLQAWQVMYDPFDKRVCFPMYNFAWKLVGVQGRTIVNADLRYRRYIHKNATNPTVWYGEWKVDLDKPVIFCEGPFDALSINRAYSNVVASLTTGMSKEKVLRMGGATDIITFYDYGKGGDTARKIVSKHLGGKAAIVHLIPPKVYDDPGAMPRVKIVEMLSPYLKCNQ